MPNMSSKVEKQMPSDDIAHYLSFNLKILEYMGLKVSLDGTKDCRKSRLIGKLAIFVTSILTSYTASLQFTGTIDALMRNETYLATQISTHLFSNSLCLAKGIRLVVKVSAIEALLRDVALLWTRHLPRRGDEQRTKILEQAGRTLLICKVFTVITMGGIFSFSLPPLEHMTAQYLNREALNHTFDYSLRVLILKYPFEVNDALTYALVFVEEQYLIIASGVFWFCCDSLFAQLTSHVSMQFQILQHDTESLINNETVGDKLRANIVTFVKRHQQLLKVCNKIEKIYSPVVLTTVLLSGMNLCVNVFDLSETASSGNYAAASVHGLLFMITLFQIVFYCTFAETLTHQSSEIANAIYNCKWLEKDHKFRVYLQMIILKSQHPFYCTGYGFFPIGHQRLTTVLNTSFSYYMMLQATKTQ